jgi:hypothetical protein
MRPDCYQAEGLPDELEIARAAALGMPNMKSFGLSDNSPVGREPCLLLQAVHEP